MTKQLETGLNSQSYHWLDIAETTSVIVSIGSSVASLFFKEIFFVSIPFSVCVALNLVNRNRISSITTTKSNKAISELTQKDQDNHSNISQKLTQLQQLNNNQLTKYQTENKTLSQKINKLNTDLNKRTHTLENEFNQIAIKIENLSQIESLTQSIKASPNLAEFYYLRGQSYQEMNNKKGAMEDYTKVIELDSSYALAYHNRGILNADLGNKKAAVEDLRKAAKFYFEKGDLDNYKKTRNMSQDLHELNSDSKDQDELNSDSKNQDSDQVLASSLFL